MQAEARQREAQRQAEEAAAAEAEKAKNLASPWLSEAPECGVSALALHRVRPDHFKGLAPAHKAAIIATVAQQVEAKRAADQQAAAEQAAYEAREAAAVAEVERRAAAADAERRRQAGQLAAVQQAQAADAQRREAETAACMKSQQPTPAYFAQFGTSHR